MSKHIQPFIAIALLCLSLSSNTDAKDASLLIQQPEPNKSNNHVVSYIKEESGLSILNFSGNYDQSVSGNLNIEARQAVAEELFQHIPDQFDFLVVFTTFPINTDSGNAFAITLENDVSGIGLPLFDNSSLLNSENLQATIDMGFIGQWELNPGNRSYDTTLDVLVHEMMHRWGVYVSFEDENDEISDELLGRDDVHWNYFLHSHASLMYGSSWTAHSTGQFETTAVSLSLSPLDLYLMGFNEANEVPDFFLIESGSPGDRTDTPPMIGTQATGTRTNVSIEDIIAAEGLRLPDVHSSQKQFNFKFVLLKTPSENIDDATTGALLVLQKEFQKRFFAETGGMGEISFPSMDETVLAGNPDVLDYPVDTNPFYDPASAEAFITGKLSTQSEWGDKQATVARDTATVLDVMNLLSLTDWVTAGENWISSFEPTTHDEMAWLLLSGGLSAIAQDALVQQLKGQMNSDGGWGLKNGSDSSSYDTALVLRALVAVEGDGYIPSAHTLTYVLNQINEDGGFGYAKGGASALASSSMMLHSIFELTNNSAAEQQLIDFVLSKQQPDGGFGVGQSTAHETALVIEALNAAQNQSHVAATADALTKLGAMQSVDGSFEGSLYATALSMKLLTNEEIQNISLTHAVISNDRAIAGENIAIDFTILNGSELAFNDVTVAVKLNEQIITSGYISSLPEQQSTSDRIIFNTDGMDGTVNLSLVVDYENTIDESNESDNDWPLMIQVQPVSSTPELAFDWNSLAYDPTTVVELPFELNTVVEVSNLSSVNLNEIEVSLAKVSGEFSHEIMATQSISINAQSSHAVNLNTTINQIEGAASFVLLIDPNNQIQEVNEDNNRIQIDLDVEPLLDLTIYEENVSLVDSFILGRSEVVSFAITNPGTQSSPGFDVKVFYLGSNGPQLLYENFIPELNAGQSLNREFSWTPNEIGNHQLEWLIDQADVVAEFDEGNNQLILPVTVTNNAQTNLQLVNDSFSINPNPGLAGQDLDLSVIVLNTSNNISGSFEVNFYQQMPDSPKLLIDAVSVAGPLAAQGQIEINSTLHEFQSHGDITFVAEVDPSKVIDEYNENDNVAFSSFRVLNKADGMVSAGGIELSPSQPVLGENMTVEISVANLGEQALEDGELHLYTSSSDIRTQVGQRTIPLIPAGTSYIATFDFVFPNDTSMINIEAEFDVNDEISEINESNNHAKLLIENQNRDFYVTEKYISPNGDGIKDRTIVVFDLDESDDITIQVINDSGMVVKSFPVIAQATFGDLAWDGRNDEGQVVVDGHYELQLIGSTTNTFKEAMVVIDTNRTPMMRAIYENTGTFFDLTCSLNAVSGQVFFSVDGKYLFSSRYVDKQGTEHRGLFRIKTDATEVKSLLSQSFLDAHRFTHTQPFKVLRDGNIIFYTQNDSNGHSELWKYSTINGNITGLNGPATDTFSIEIIEDSFTLVRFYDSGQYHYYKVFHDPLIPIESLNFAVNGEQVYTKKKLSNGWVWVTEDDNQNSNYYFDHNENLSAPVLLAQYPSSAELNVSENGRFFYIHSKATGELKYYQVSQNQLTLLIDEVNDSMANSAIKLLRDNQLLKVSNGESRVYGQSGQVLLNAHHMFDLDYFKTHLIQEFGSLDNLILYHEVGEIPYALTDLQDLSVEIQQLQVSGAAEHEVYLRFTATLSGTLDLSSIGYSNELVQIYANDFINQRIEYSDLNQIIVSDLNQMKVYDPPLYEGLSPLFLMGSKVYPKSFAQDVEQNDSEWLNSFQFNTKTDTQHWPQVVKKALMHSHYLPFHTRCAQFEDEFFGVYQATENLTAFLSTEVHDGVIEVAGSAFDVNFDHLTLEWQSIGSDQQSWQLINVIETPVYDDFMTFWTPPVAGQYRLRLTVYDQAGNQSTDTSDAFVGQVNIDISNPIVSPAHFSPNGDGTQDEVLIEFDVLQTAELVIEIKNNVGNLVRTITREYIGAQSDAVVWNGLGDQGQILPEGVYTISFNNYSYQVILDVTPPEVFLRMAEGQKGLHYYAGMLYTYPWSLATGTYAFLSDDYTDQDHLLLNARTQAYEVDTQSWSTELSHGCGLFFSFNFFFDLFDDQLYRCHTIDLAGNQSNFAEVTFDIDPIYSTQLIKTLPANEFYSSVNAFSCPKDFGNELTTNECMTLLLDQTNAPDIVDWAIGGELYFALESFSNQAITEVKMVTQYESSGSVFPVVEEQELNFADQESLLSAFPNNSQILITSPNSPPGMFGTQHSRKSYYLKLKPEYFPDTDQVIETTFEFIYEQGLTHELQWHIQFKNNGKELLLNAETMMAKGVDFLPSQLQYETANNEQLSASLEEMINVTEISDNKDYWLFVKTKADDIENPSLTVEISDQSPVLYQPAYATGLAADNTNPGFEIQLFEIDHQPCFLPAVTYQGISDDGSNILLEEGIGGHRPFCLTELHVNQKYMAGESCNSNFPKDPFITIGIDGLLGANSSEPATLEVYRLQDAVEEMLFITTNFDLLHENGLTSFLTEVVFDKSAFAAGTQNIFIRFKDAEGNEFEEQAEILVQNQIANTVVIEPSGSQVYCAAELSQGEVQISAMLQFDNNSNKNVKAYQYNEGSLIKPLTGVEIYHEAFNLVDDLLYEGYLLEENWILKASEYAGDSQILIETINSTGVSQCTAIDVQIDALLDADISALQNTQYLSPLGTGYNKELGYLNVYGRESLHVQVELFQLDDQGEEHLLGLLVDEVLLAETQKDLYWDGYYLGSLLGDGVYRLMSTITDTCGLNKQLDVYVVIDRVLPMIQFEQPINGQTVSGLENVLATINDSNLNPELTSLSFAYNSSWNPIEIVDIYSIVEGEFQLVSLWNLSQFPADLYQLRMTAIDQAGNENEAIIEVTFTDSSNLFWDLSASDRYLSPNNDQVKDATTLFIGLNLNVELTTEVINSNQTVVRTLTDGLVLDQGGHEVVWNGEDDLGLVVPDGVYEIIVAASESGAPGNVTELSLEVVVDTMSPDGVLSPNEQVIKGVGNLTLELTDANLQQAHAWIQQFDPVGPEVLTLQTAVTGQFVLSELSELNESTQHLRVMAIDKAGNQIELTHTFTVDNTAPEIVLAEPQDFSFHGGTSPDIEITGEVMDVHFEGYQIDLSPAADPPQWQTIGNGTELQGDTFAMTWPISVPDGDYWLKVMARDAAEWLSETAVEITIDTTSPHVSLDTPTDQAIQGTQIKVAGSVTDDHLSFYTLSYKAADEGDNEWVLFHTQFEPITEEDILDWQHNLPSGLYDLRLQATDQVGLQSEVVIQIEIDVNPPAPALFLNADFNGTDVSIEWQASASPETEGYWLYRDNQVLNQTLLTTTSFQDLAVADGQYSYWVVAVDGAGNMSLPSNTDEVLVDRTGPDVIIIAPTNGQRISGLLPIHGTAYSDADFGQYRLFYRLAADGAPGSMMAQSEFAVLGAQIAELDTTMLIQDTEYVIRLEANDLSGNTTHTEHSIWVDNVAPAAPQNLTYLFMNDNEVQLNWNAANTESDLLGYLLFRNNVLISGDGTIDGSLITTTSWLDLDVPDGHHNYHVVAVDVAKNFSQNSNVVQVQIDIQPPHVIFTHPLNGTEFEAAIALQASSADLDIAQVQFDYSLDGLVWNSVGADTNAPFAVTFDPAVFGLSHGPVFFRATATDLTTQVDPNPEVITAQFTDLTPPEPIAGLSALVTGRDIQLNWNAASEIDLKGYVVGRKRLQPNPQSEFINLTSSSFNETQYEDQGLSDGTYLYRLHAVDNHDNPSNPVIGNELMVYVVHLDQPYSPLLLPAEVTFTGITPGIGELAVALTNSTGTTQLSNPSITSSGTFSVNDAELVEGLNEISVSQLDGLGNRSVSGHVGVQLSPIPPLPLNLVNNLNGYDLSMSWQAPEPGIFGYMPYINQQPALELMPLNNSLNTTVSSSAFASYAITDGDLLSSWAPSYVDRTDEVPVFVQIEWPERSWITEVRIHWEQDYNFDGDVSEPSHYALQLRSPVGWITHADYSGNENAMIAYQPNKPYLTDGLRVWMPLGDTGGPRIALSEIEIWYQPIVKDTSFDRTLDDGIYQVQLSAINEYGFESAATTIEEIIVGDVLPPAAVTLEGQLVNGNQVDLTWTASASVDVGFYRLYQNGDLVYVTSDAATLNHTVLDLLNGTHLFHVVAVDDSGNASPFSNVLAFEVTQQLLPAPQGLTITAPETGHELNLSWQAVMDPSFSHYIVYRSESASGGFVPIHQLTTSTYDDVGLINGVRYHYQVTAVDLTGNESQPSLMVSGLPLDLQPPNQPVITAPTDHDSPINVNQLTIDVSGLADPGVEVSLHQNDVEILRTFSTTEYSELRQPINGNFDSPVFNPHTGLFIYYDFNTGDVKIADPVTGTSVALQSFDVRDYFWSHDGTLVYALVGYGNQSSLRVFDLDGTELDTLFNGYQINKAMVSIDGNQIFYWGEGVNPNNSSVENGLWLVDPVNDEFHKVNINQNEELHQPAMQWLSNEMLAFINFPNDIFSQGELWLLNTLTFELTAVGPAAELSTLRSSVDAEYLFYEITVNGHKAINRTRTSDLSVLTQTWDNNDLQNPLVGNDSNRVLVDVGCCDKAIIDMNTGETILNINDTGFAAQGAWLSDNHIVMLSNNEIIELSPPGIFELTDVTLNPGLNEFHVMAHKTNGMDSTPSAPIAVTLNDATLADLEIKDHYLQLLPVQVVLGQSISGTVAVKNVSQVDVDQARLLLELTGPDLTTHAIAPSPLDFSLSAGELMVEDFTIDPPVSLGEYTVRVVADSNKQVLETNEYNNSVVKVIQVVDDAIPDIQLTLNAATLLPNEDLNGTIRVYNPGMTFDGSIALRITDADGFAVGFIETYAIDALPPAQVWQQSFSWNTADVFAGEYLVEVSLLDQNQQQIDLNLQSLTVAELAQMSLSLTTSVSQIELNEALNLTANVLYQLGNVAQSGQLKWEIYDENEILVFSAVQPTGSLVPGFNGSFNQSWIASQPGDHEVRVQLQTNLVTESALMPFSVLPVTATVTLDGLIQELPAPVILGRQWQVDYQLSNPNSMALQNVPISLSLWREDLSEKLLQETWVTSISGGASSQQSVTWDSNALTTAPYVLVLSADLSGFGGSDSYLVDTLTIQSADIDGPQISIVEPQPMGHYPSSFEMRAVIIDQHANIEQVRVMLDGTQQASLAGQGLNDNYQYWLTGVSEGPHEVLLEATDDWGNIGIQSVTIQVDNTAPVIDISGVNDGGLYNSSVQAEVVITELNLANTLITLDGVPYISGSPIIEEGSHILMVVATDLAGNTSTRRITFNLDLTAPVVIINHPANNSETNQLSISVSGNTEAMATVNLVNGTYQASIQANHAGLFSLADVPLASGSNSIIVGVTDLAGNTGIDTTVNVTLIDGVNVTGSLGAGSSHNLGDTMMVDWQLTNQNNFPVTQLPLSIGLYRVADNQLQDAENLTADLTAAGVLVGTSDFATDTLGSGPHRLEMQVQIEGQWQLLDDHLIELLDVMGPELTVVEPTPNQLFGNNVEFVVLANDAHSDVNEVSYQLDGSSSWVPMTWNGVEFGTQLSLTHGDHQVVFKAEDSHVNVTTSAVVTFAVDTQGPMIEVNSPSDGLITNQPVLVDFEVTDDHDFVAVAELNQTTINNGDLVDAEGSHELIIMATDEVGNSASVTREFIIDSTAPVLMVTAPINNSQNSTGHVVVNGSSEPSNTIGIDVNGSFSVVKTDAAGQFNSPELDLQVGMNLITVTATDQAGNVSEPQFRQVEYIEVGALSGRVWQDDDQDGMIDGGEVGFNQVALRITDDNQISQEILTDTMGYYSLMDLVPGEYTVAVIEEALLNEWVLTTNNNPSQVIVEVNLTSTENFGFYQEKPILVANVRANKQIGRLLLLVDPGTAQVDSNQCQGISDYRLQRRTEHSWAFADVIAAQLFDAQGTLIQTETAAYVDFINNGQQVIDQQGGTSDVNLLLLPPKNGVVAAWLQHASGANPAIMTQPYQLTLSLQSTQGVTSWSSGLIDIGCELMAEIGGQVGDLQVADVGLFPALATDDPNGPYTAPYLASQQVMLENMLLSEGWSFDLVTEASEFSEAMATGQYVAYALLAENVLLSDTQQDQLMQAVDAGAGLLVASGHDNLTAQSYSSMGVNVMGTHQSAIATEWLASPFSASEVLTIEPSEPVLQVSLSGALGAAHFNGPGVNQPNHWAISWLDGSEGSVVFAGLDWMLQAMGQGGINGYMTKLKAVFSYTHPLGLSNELGHARSVQFELVNSGRAVAGHVQVLLPETLILAHSDTMITPNPDGFSFAFDLAEGETINREFWLMVNDSPATITFEVYIDNDVEVHQSLDLTLIAGERPDLSAAITNCQAGVKNGQSLTYRYVIDNTGNKSINGAAAYAEFDTGLASPNWTCLASSGSHCHQMSGTGNLTGQLIDVQIGGQVEFIFQTMVVAADQISVLGMAEVLMPNEVFDVNPANNSAHDYDEVYSFVYKDGFECVAPGQMDVGQAGTLTNLEGW